MGARRVTVFRGGRPGLGFPVHASSHSGAWRSPSGRNVIPPSLDRPGPFVTLRRWLRTSRAEAREFETTLLDEHGLAQVGFGEDHVVMS